MNKTSCRISPVTPQQATGKTRQFYEGAKAKFGFVSNLLQIFGASPAALEGYVSFNGALAAGSFSPQLREQIALAVAEANMCSYCLSVHAFIGNQVGLTTGDISAARQASATPARSDAVLKLARSIIVLRGDVSDAEIQRARDGGLTDGEIVETVANVALNMLLNYMNHIALPKVDFPEVKPGVGYDDVRPAGRPKSKH